MTLRVQLCHVDKRRVVWCGLLQALGGSAAISVAIQGVIRNKSTLMDRQGCHKPGGMFENVSLGEFLVTAVLSPVTWTRIHQGAV